MRLTFHAALWLLTSATGCSLVFTMDGLTGGAPIEGDSGGEGDSGSDRGRDGSSASDTAGDTGGETDVVVEPSCPFACPALGGHQHATCGADACAVACDSDFEDCNGNPADGCEADLSSIQSCGTCGHTCGMENGATSCNGGLCTFTCNPGWLHCGDDDSLGCTTQSDDQHCGSCSNACAVGTMCNGIFGQCQ